jgi:primary-amine oxidase
MMRQRTRTGEQNVCTQLMYRDKWHRYPFPHPFHTQYHQHMFSVRLDLAVDDAQGGRNLKVSEIDVVALPQHPETNPAGNAFIVQETVLQNEAEAQRIADPMKARYWKVFNPNSIHPTTKKGVGYKIMAPGAPLLLAAPGSSLTKRGAFATRTLWVTPHKDEEKYPAGDYPTQAEGGEGLPTWTAANRSLEDPVVWLTLGATHIPRVEDFPIMPCEVVGFMLKPFCFFNGNPGVDLPADANAASTLAGNSACCAANGTA